MEGTWSTVKLVVPAVKKKTILKFSRRQGKETEDSLIKSFHYAQILELDSIKRLGDRESLNIGELFHWPEIFCGGSNLLPILLQKEKKRKDLTLFLEKHHFHLIKISFRKRLGIRLYFFYLLNNQEPSISQERIIEKPFHITPNIPWYSIFCLGEQYWSCLLCLVSCLLGSKRKRMHKTELSPCRTTRTYFICCACIQEWTSLLVYCQPGWAARRAARERYIRGSLQSPAGCLVWSLI